MQTLLFVAQEIDISKWSSTIVSGLLGFAILVAMRTQLTEILRRIDKTDAKIEALAERQSRTDNRVERTETKLEERTRHNTGAHQVIRPNGES